jgi:hypothetical protein
MKPINDKTRIDETHKDFNHKLVEEDDLTDSRA